MVIILFSALVLNMFAAWRSAENDLAKEQMVRISMNRDQVVWLNESVQAREQHLARTSDHIQFLRWQQNELQKKLRSAYTTAAAKVNVVPKRDHVSVLDLPTLPKLGRREHQKWAIHVPDAPAFRVQVDFVQRSSGTESIQNQPTFFDDQSSLSIDLKPRLMKCLHFPPRPCPKRKSLPERRRAITLLWTF